jgi:SAM-dependent methyltransferase
VHESSLEKMRAFARAYLSPYQQKPLRILDVGSRVAHQRHRTYRDLFTAASWSYTGADIEPGDNVDVVLANHYRWSDLEDDYFDVVVCGQVFEHIPYFWVTAFEIGRVLKEGGLACIVAPAGGHEHRYPVDCWRFYTDGLASLCEYLGFRELEAYTQRRNLYHDDGSDAWMDSCLVMQKPRFSEFERRRFRRRSRLHRALVEPEELAGPEFGTSAPPREPSVIEPATSQEAFLAEETRRLNRLGALYTRVRLRGRRFLSLARRAALSAVEPL